MLSLKKILEYSIHKLKSLLILILTLRNSIRHRFGYGGSGITKELKNWIWQNIKKSETVVELVAGLVSTRILSKRYNLVSGEDNLNYVGLYSRANYVHADIDSETQWYRLKPDQLPIEFKLLIFDGPSGSHLRSNILQCGWILERTNLIIVDDTWRKSEKMLAESICTKLGGEVTHENSFSAVRNLKALNL